MQVGETKEEIGSVRARSADGCRVVSSRGALVASGVTVALPPCRGQRASEPASQRQRDRVLLGGSAVVAQAHTHTHGRASCAAAQTATAFCRNA